MTNSRFNRILIRHVLCFLLFVPLWGGCSCKPDAVSRQGSGNNAHEEAPDSGPLETPPDSNGKNGSPESSQTSTPEIENVVSMVLTSSAFQQGAPIPEKFTSDGLDLSPPLAWKDAPEETQEFALICTDPDAPTADPWVHWLIYKIPAAVTELSDSVPQDLTLGAPLFAAQGQNSWTTGRTVGYRGPDPPKGHGVHHYHFTLYALDSKLDLEPGADIDDLLEGMHGKILASTELVGTYTKE